MEALAGLAEALETSSFGIWAARSAWAYPIANVVHVLGLVLLLGGIGIVDLRLLGAFRTLPLAAVSAALTPLAVGGLVLLLASGLTMFAADASAMAASGTFRQKLVLIAVALANAAAFRFLFGGRVAGWTTAPPPAARAMALASLLLWTAVAVWGRMIAYS
ncbi:MAG: DUF6644 family protein [Allosphingosinicella sp.]|uniref:DUF6644 family protein n=1 Tax=Allosphingosinicella sp. TaxID=2823234 RepID=UPI0039239D3B